MTNVLSIKYGPTRPEHLEVGAYYLVHGTNSFGQPIPLQLLQPIRPIRQALLESHAWTVEAWTWMLIDGLAGVWKDHQHHYPLGGVNLTTTGVYHDRYLERIDPDDWQAARRRDYYWLLRGARTPNVVVA